MPAIPCTLNKDAALHITARQGAPPPPGWVGRIARGERVQAHATNNVVQGGYHLVTVDAGTQIAVLGHPLQKTSQVFEGYVSRTSLVPDSRFVTDFMALQNVAADGVQELPGNWHSEDFARQELVDRSRACALVSFMADSIEGQTAEISDLKARILRLSKGETLLALAGLGLAVAGTVVTFGALAPVLAAVGVGISVTAGGAGFKRSQASARIDEINNALSRSTGDIARGTALKGTAAVGTKETVVNSTAAGSGSAAAAAASSALGVVGGVIGVASAARHLHKAASSARSNRIVPAEGVLMIDWRDIYTKLNRDLEDTKRSKDYWNQSEPGHGLAAEFDLTIHSLTATLDKIEHRAFA